MASLQLVASTPLRQVTLALNHFFAQPSITCNQKQIYSKWRVMFKDVTSYVLNANIGQQANAVISHTAATP